MVRRHRRKTHDITCAPLGFRVANFSLLALLSAAFIGPFLMMLTASLMHEEEIMRTGFTLLSKALTLDAYRYIFTSSSQFINAFKVTLLLTVIGTCNTLFFTFMGAYALSKKDLPHRRGMTLFVLIPMLFNGGLIPWFLVVRELGLTNTFFALFIPGTISIWNLFIVRNYFMGMPQSIEESAMLDGAGYFRIYFQFVLPLSLPIVAVMVVYVAVMYWNEWYSALILLPSNKKLHTLQLLLRNLLSNTTVIVSDKGQRITTGASAIAPSESLKMAAVMVATLPILIVYPFLQKYFVKGLIIGSMKG